MEIRAFVVRGNQGLQGKTGIAVCSTLSGNRRTSRSSVRHRSSVERPFHQHSNLDHMTTYPTQSELLNCLTEIASVAGDTTGMPFRVDVIPLNGKPPMYSVMIKSPAKDLLRRQIGQILGRGFALGATSFMLSGAEALALIKQRAPQPQSGVTADK